MGRTHIQGRRERPSKQLPPSITHVHHVQGTGEYYPQCYHGALRQAQGTLQQSTWISTQTLLLIPVCSYVPRDCQPSCCGSPSRRNLLDFSKTFDKLPHNRLFHNLDYYRFLETLSTALNRYWPTYRRRSCQRGYISPRCLSSRPDLSSLEQWEKD